MHKQYLEINSLTGLTDIRDATLKDMIYDYESMMGCVLTFDFITP